MESYVLDAEGNRITSHRSNLHVTDPANRLVEDEQHQFEYDVNGNLVRKTVKASSLTWRYGYSVWDELVSVSRHASPTMGAAADLAVTWRYDALGRRAAEERRDGAGAVTGAKTFLHDGEHVAVEADVDGTGLATAPRRFSHTDGTDDIAAITLAAGAGPVSPTAQATGVNAPSAASYYYSTDHQGSVRAVTDDMGTVVNSYSYDSYGNPETAVEALAQPLRYTGREYDAATGLYHYRARAFDPSTGRFLQEDPIWFEAGDLNVYRYTWNNPTNWTDPSGMSSDYAALNGDASAKGSSFYSLGRQLACQFSTLAGVVAVFTPAGTGGALYHTIEIISDVEVGCGVKTATKSQITVNRKNGKAVEDYVQELLRNLGTLDCENKGKNYKTKAGWRFVDAIVCLENTKINIEIKNGDAIYGKLQRYKDQLILSVEKIETIVVRYRPYEKL